MIPLRAPSRLGSILAAGLAVALLAAPTALAEPPPRGEALACGQDITRTDANGTFHLRFQCLPTQGLLNWGFTFNPQWRAMAIGPVTESGLRYWQNGSQKSDNSDHEVPVDYIFHGTVPNVSSGTTSSIRTSSPSEQISERTPGPRASPSRVQSY